MHDTLSVAYVADSWHEFFIGSAGGVAALSGLIFVAVSVNLKEILAADRAEGGTFLTGRAIEALVSLLIALGICVVGLAPEISSRILGAFVLLTAAISTISPVRALVAFRALASQPGVSRPKAFTARVILALAFFASLVAAGVTIVAQAGGGLYWLPVCFIIAIVVAAVNAWVLLVEVMR